MDSDVASVRRTLISHAGTVAHVGQFFFDESWNDKVFALPPYTYNTNNRTLNAQDGIFSEENADGNDAIIEYVARCQGLKLFVDDLPLFSSLIPLGRNLSSHGFLGFVSE